MQRIIAISVLLVSLFVIAPAAGAFDQKDFETFKNTGSCPGCDLSGVSFGGSYVDFKKANLSGANLSGANLSWVNLKGANLQNADLSGANLNTAFLNRANLLGANLSGANMANCFFEGATWTDGRKCYFESIGMCSFTPSSF